MRGASRRAPVEAPAPARAAIDAEDVHFWLAVLHNNDGESDLIDAGTGLEDFGGVARFATVVEELRDQALQSPYPNEFAGFADALLWQASQLAVEFGVRLPDVALQNGGGIRNDSEIPAGNDISGRFAQTSGFAFEWDPNGTAQTLDSSGNVVVPGARVLTVVLNPGTPREETIVSNGTVIAGADITIATIDFLARGGDQYPYRGVPFTSVGVTYQQALANYIVNGLGGMVTAADHPAGGEGRIVRLGAMVASAR